MQNLSLSFRAAPEQGNLQEARDKPSFPLFPSLVLLLPSLLGPHWLEVAREEK